MRTSIIVISILTLSGCLPYSSKFSCPEGDKGKCQSIEQTYKESYGRNLSPATEKDDHSPSSPTEGTAIEQVFNQSVFEKELPLVMPAEVMRIKILPYRAEPAVLYMGRYVYVIKDSPKFLLEELTK